MSDTLKIAVVIFALDFMIIGFLWLAAKRHHDRITARRNRGRLDEILTACDTITCHPVNLQHMSAHVGVAHLEPSILVREVSAMGESDLALFHKEVMKAADAIAASKEPS